MAKKITSEYDSELDTFHAYSEEIKKGITGCLSIGDFNIDIGDDNKVVGIELEQASKNLHLSPEILSSPDKADLIIQKSGNNLLMGVGIIKGMIQSSTHITALPNQMPMPVRC
jgi:uncharacterized protein YuzE